MKGGREEMVNQVKQKVKETLKGLYPTYHVYLEESTPANLLLPALSIHGLKKVTVNQGEKRIQNIKLEVTCQIEGADAGTTYWNISDKLDEALTYIDLEGVRLRTGEKTSEIKDAKLHYSFDLQLMVAGTTETVAAMMRMDKQINL